MCSPDLEAKFLLLAKFQYLSIRTHQGHLFAMTISIQLVTLNLFTKPETWEGVHVCFYLSGGGFN